jgi:hypothetical protein
VTFPSRLNSHISIRKFLAKEWAGRDSVALGVRWGIGTKSILSQNYFRKSKFPCISNIFTGKLDLTDVHLPDVYLPDMRPRRRIPRRRAYYIYRRASHGRASHGRVSGVYFTGVYLMAIYLINMHLTGVHLMGVHLTNVHLTGVYLMGVYLSDGIPIGGIVLFSWYMVTGNTSPTRVVATAWCLGCLLLPGPRSCT